MCPAKMRGLRGYIGMIGIMDKKMETMGFRKLRDTFLGDPS